MIEENPNIVSGLIRENGRTYVMYKCPFCNIINRVRTDRFPKIKSCHPCHHKVARPEKPEGSFEWCNKCKQWKSHDNFCFRKGGKIRSCKKCENDYRLNNLDRINKYSKKYRKNNIEKSLLYSARSRSKENNLEINIDLSDILVPKKCPVLGIDISTSTEDKDSSPSLDRINPALGYIKGNVRVVSWRANWIKNNMTISEIKALYEDSKKWKCRGNKSMK